MAVKKNAVSRKSLVAAAKDMQQVMGCKDEETEALVFTDATLKAMSPADIEAKMREEGAEIETTDSFRAETWQILEKMGIKTPSPAEEPKADEPAEAPAESSQKKKTKKASAAAAKKETAKKPVEKAPAAKAAPKSAAKAKTGGASATALKPKKPVDLAALTAFPASFAKWQEQCGGEGYCLSGSGQPVARRFKPGFDAKLKSALKRVGTKSAKKIAAALGWTDTIKWAK